MTMTSASGYDVLITVACLVVLLFVSLIMAWRRDDRERRMERLRQRGLA